MRKFKRGQRLAGIPADLLNDAAAAKRDKRDGFGGDPATPARTQLPFIRVKVKNTSAVDVPRFGVMQVSGVAISPVDDPDTMPNEQILLVEVPAAETFRNKPLVILQDPLSAAGDANGRDIGDAAIGGVSPVLVDVTIGDQQYCKIVDGSTTTADTAANSRIRAIWLPEVGEDSPGLAYLSNAPVGATRVRGRATEDSGGDITLGCLVGIDGDIDGYPQTITVKNVHRPAWEVAAGDIVRAEYVVTLGQWEAYQLDCDGESGSCSDSDSDSY